MASLEHFNRNGRDCFRLRFGIGRKRYSVGLGSFDEPAAEVAKEFVEHLVEQHVKDRPPSARASRWLDSLPDSIHDRLAGIGLTEARKQIELPRTVLAYMRKYIKSRTDWKKPENSRQSVNHLETFFRNRDVPLTSLTQGDMERFHRWMISDEKGPNLSPNTAGQHVKRCRQMFRQALKDKLVDENPCEGVKIDLRSDKSKNVYIDQDAARAILEACIDQEWRVIFALGRYGGLRCPSEVLKLRWSDILWDQGRFRVTSSKTRRYGKGERIVPLFPEIRSELDALFAMVQPGMLVPIDSYVITRYRSAEANLRTQFLRIVNNAGVAKFAKPFMALRASRRTELERTGRFANHVLNDWFGHSGAVAETHYLRTTEDDFAEATGDVGHAVGHAVGLQDAAPNSTDDGNPKEKPPMLPLEGGIGGIEYTLEDSNL